MRSVILISVFTVLGVVVKAQSDSIEYGRYFIGMDLSPVTVLGGNTKPDGLFQFKMVSLANPCNRLRVAFTNVYRENQHLNYVKPGVRTVDYEGYNSLVKTSGAVRLTTIGAGIEKVVPFRRFDFVYGADVLAGRKCEFEHRWFSEFSAPDSMQYTLYNSSMSYEPGKIISVVAGLAPYAGVEFELGERISFQTSVRGLLACNKVVKSSRDRFSTVNSLRSKGEAYITGLNLLIYYRF